MNVANTSTLTLEQRVAALEATIQAMQSQAGTGIKLPWLERISGILADEPDFGKVIEYGRYWREHGEEPPQAVE